MSRLGVMRCLLAAATVAVSSSAALAQRPYPSYSADPFPYQRPYKWAGLYVGLQAAYTFTDVKAESGPYGGPFNQTYGYTNDGLAGGVHAGYNWQYGHYLWGFEADIDAANINTHGTGSLGYDHQTHVDWQSTIRGRLGWITGPWLLYGTGGIAFSQASVAKTLPLAFTPFASAGERYVGWTLGAGVERAINESTTLRLEYRYTDYGSVEFSNATANTVDRTTLTSNAIRAAISFRF